jgi:hypothetical protein
MTNQLEIQPSQLTTAAQQARSAAAAVNGARQATGAALPDNAFGIMCSPLLLPIYITAQAAADTLMDSASSAVTRAADELDKTAEAFTQTDQASNTKLLAILG